MILQYSCHRFHLVGLSYGKANIVKIKIIENFILTLIIDMYYSNYLISQMKDFHCFIMKLFFFLFVIFNFVSAQNTSTSGPESAHNQIIKTASNQDNKIEIRIANQQVFFMSIKQLVPKIYNETAPIIPTLTPVKNKKTHRTSSSICSVIHAPNHKAYKEISMQKHKIKNATQWEDIAYKKSVIYKLQDIEKLEYALDMQVINNTLVVIFEDGQVIFFTQEENKLSEVATTLIFENKSEAIKGGGKINWLGNNFGIFVSSKYAILIDVSTYKAVILSGYEENNNLYTSIVVDNMGEKNLFIAHGKYGIMHYIIDYNQPKIQKVFSYQVYITEQINKRVSVVDIVSITHFVNHGYSAYVLLALSPRYGIMKINIERADQKFLKAQRTSLQNKNCHMMSMHFQQVYISCPQILIYNPKNDSVHQNVLLSSLPIEFLSNQQDLTVISHNSFQTIERCSGRANAGWIEEKTFHHTVIFGDNYVSIDDLSITVWQINYPQQFIACKGTKDLQGNNTFNISINSFCQENGQVSCCKDVFQVELQIYDSDKGLHIFQIFGTIFIILAALGSSIFIIVKKRIVQSQYLHLHQETELSFTNDSQNEKVTVPKIFPTEEAIQQHNDGQLVNVFQNN